MTVNEIVISVMLSVSLGSVDDDSVSADLFGLVQRLIRTLESV